MLLGDGQLVRYTSEMRHAVEQQDHDAGHSHLALLEWSKQITAPEFATVEARTQILMFLLRQLFVGHTRTKKPLNENMLAGRLKYLLRLLDTPGVQRAVLQRVLDDLLAVLGEPHPS